MGLLDQLNEVLVQQPRKYWGDKATRLGSLLSDSAATGAQAYGSANSPMAPEHANTLAGLLADFTPGLGDVKSAYDGMQSAREGDYLGAALGGLGALPMVPNLAGMFIGKGAKTWDAVNASRAMEMEKAGIDPRKIWSETGNWKGPDGHWRQEIPDNSARWQGGSNGERGAGTGIKGPDALIVHNPLASSYRDMKKIDFHQNTGTSSSGSYRPATPEDRFSFGNPELIRISGADNEQKKLTALHELQHAIQEREGWAKGGSLDSFISGAQLNPATGQQVTMEEAYQMYLKLAGEAEARATQARAGMNAAQRRNIFPTDSYDVPINSLILDN